MKAKNNLIDIDYIKSNLKTEILGKNEFIYYKETDSTNNKAKELTSLYKKEGLVVTTDSQTNGRGRFGRFWHSPSSDKGIYLSTVIKPNTTIEKALILTLGAALATSNAIETISGFKAKIKWPNDIMNYDKKIAGILVESALNNNMVDYIVIGIGINVNHDSNNFPQELLSTAGSMFLTSGNKYNRNNIIIELLFELENIYKLFCDNKENEIIEKWKQKSITLNNYINVKLPGNQFIKGFAKDIKQDGSLILELENKTTRIITSGEIL